MKTPEQLKAYVADHPKLSPSEVASNLRRHGVTAVDVQRAMGAPGRPTVGKLTSDLFVQFDDVAKVKSAMRALPKNEHFEDEDLRRRLLISIPRWREVANHPSLANFRFLLPNKKHVWMHPEAQRELARRINLSQS